MDSERRLLSIQPVDELRLGHRGFYIRGHNSGHILAATQDGLVSIIGPNRRLTHRFEVGEPIESINFGPKGELALTLKTQLEFRQFDGTTIRPAITGQHLDAWFDDGGRLWTVRAEDSGASALVSVYSSDQDPAPLAACILQDPFGQSSWICGPLSSGGQVPVWVAAGQDGQTVYFMRWGKDGLSASRLEGVPFCGPPVLHNTGDEFLLFTEDQLRRYSYPECKLLGAATFDSVQTEGMGLEVHYLSSDQAIVHLEEGHLYVVDLRDMSLTNEIEIVGHAQRPIGELYPTLAHEGGCANDFVQLIQVDQGQYVSIHSELPDEEGKQHGVLAWWPPTRQVFNL